MHLKR